MTIRSHVGLFVVTIAVVLAGCASQEAMTKSETAAGSTPPPTAAATAVRAATDITIAELLDDPKKLAVFRKYAPAVADNPQIGQARSMSLADVAGYAANILTPEVVASIAKEISRL